MKSLTEHLWFNTKKRQEFIINIIKNLNADKRKSNADTRGFICDHLCAICDNLR